MAYVTQQNVEHAAGGAEKLIQLTDLEGTGVVNTALLDETIKEAQAWINSYLETRFAVPIPDDDVSDIIRRVTAQEVVYLLRESRKGLAPTDYDRHQERMEWLDAVRMGRVSPGLDAAAQKGARVNPETGTRVAGRFSLTREKFQGFT